LWVSLAAACFVAEQAVLGARLPPTVFLRRAALRFFLLAFAQPDLEVPMQLDVFFQLRMARLAKAAWPVVLLGWRCLPWFVGVMRRVGWECGD
jgi:hypothetical protein